MRKLDQDKSEKRSVFPSLLGEKLAYRLNDFINQKRNQGESETRERMQNVPDQNGRKASHQRTRNSVKENFSFCL